MRGVVSANLFGLSFVIAVVAVHGTPFPRQSAINGVDGTFFLGTTMKEQFGNHVLGGNGFDMDGDALPDFAIAALKAQDESGQVYVFYGAPNSTVAAAAWPAGSTAAGLLATGQAAGRVVQGKRRLGYAMTAGDFNGDGCSDLAISEDIDAAEGIYQTVYIVWGNRDRQAVRSPLNVSDLSADDVVMVASSS
jgi:hypothetical protein